MTALILLVVQGVLGASDTLYYHEWRLRLPTQPWACTELRLHAARDLIYAVLFGSLGWVVWQGALAWVVVALLAAEVLITLADFVQEDRTRKLPAGERVMHAIMGVIYGAFLAYALPAILGAMRLPTGLRSADAGTLSCVLSLMAAGVFVSGVRDLVSAQRGREWPALPVRDRSR